MSSAAVARRRRHDASSRMGPIHFCDRFAPRESALLCVVSGDDANLARLAQSSLRCPIHRYNTPRRSPDFHYLLPHHARKPGVTVYAGGALSRIVTTSTRQQRRLHHQRSSGCTAEQRLRPGRRPPTAAGQRLMPGRRAPTAAGQRLMPGRWRPTAAGLRPGRRPPTAAGMRPGRCGGDKAFDPHIDSFSDIY